MEDVNVIEDNEQFFRLFNLKRKAVRNGRYECKNCYVQTPSSPFYVIYELGGVCKRCFETHCPPPNDTENTCEE